MAPAPASSSSASASASASTPSRSSNKQNKKKRPIAVASSSAAAASSASASASASGGGGAVVTLKKVKVEQPADHHVASSSSTTAGAAAATKSNNNIKDRFLQVFEQNPEYKTNGISNSVLKEIFGKTDYLQLAPVINELMGQSRITMSKNAATNELFYQLVSIELAEQFQNLDISHKMVYQIIEKAGNMGIWTKDIRIQTNIQQQALNKIFKTLENRKLIKPVKSVTAKSKKLYMLYDVKPSQQLTGGVWYGTDLEFDHEFISELRVFILQCIRKLNNGQGVSITEILEKLQQAKISRVLLTKKDVSQIVQTLVYDFKIESLLNNYDDTDDDIDNDKYVTARKVTTMCEFNWWDVLDTDFHFRDIQFEDGVILSAHEPHHHT